MQDKVIVQAPQSREGARATSELATLEARRGELKGQLTSLTERRALLSVQARDIEGPAKRGIEDRIKALDDRTARIDDELNAIDDAVNAAIARGATPAPSFFDRVMQGTPTTPPTPPTPPGMFHFPDRSGNAMTNLLIGQGIGFLLIAFVLWRGLLRRASASPARLAPEDARRLEQLQNSVDVIALEVERISEGQRFVSKMVNDKEAEKLPRGQ